jgi:hypothetical protein
MTVYDDAEFAAINLARIAMDETEADPRSAEMHGVAVDMFKRHGAEGLTALVVALGRQCASAMLVVASSRDISTDELLDGFEQHKLDQIAGDGDE